MSSQARGRRAFRFILPALLCMLFVHVIPIFWGAYIAFIDLDIYTITRWMQAPFVGLRNFLTVFSPATDVGIRYLRSIWNVVYFGLITIPAGYFIGLLVALLLNRKFFGRTLVRGLILLPYITPDSVAYNVWRFIFQARIGIVNKYLLALGLIEEPIIWLVGDRAIYAVMIASVWKGWPFACLVLLAGLQSIPQELYEAAKIDGASPFGLFRFVTFPMLRPVSATLLLLSAIWNFHAFNQFYILLGTDPGKAHVPSTFILQEAFTNFHFGQGAAMSVFLTVVVLLMTVAILRVRKRGEEW
ncbi:carbohydrate ABC transporter permease [Candidatus Caldatribacterium sp. SIUC1]|uniref:carbohydrate ABC transporter permease n=1 Tax=Candidatus Caldatribacterium sp. SIUC1 TaxID=3418365 RepID=UPI003F692BFC